MDSRERRGGSEQSAALARTGFAGIGSLRVRIALKRPRSITPTKLQRPTAVSNPTWSEYLMGGPSVWSSVAHPALTPAIEAADVEEHQKRPAAGHQCGGSVLPLQAKPGPQPGLTTTIPRVAAALAKIEAELATAATTPSTLDSTATSTSPTDQAQQITPRLQSPRCPAVPEPATFLLTIGMAGYALWWRRRRN